MIIRIGIIGAGNIGSVLYEKCKNSGLDVRFILKDDGIYKNMTDKIGDLKNWQNWISVTSVDIVFLAIPTLDDGKTAYGYLKFFLERNIPVITCEKGAMSNYFEKLKQWKNLIGYSATAGGGTLLLKHLEIHISKEVEEIHAVINGTLNFIFSGISTGRSFDEVVEEASRLGYAEPGKKEPLEIINKEATLDIPMKTAILWNIAGLGESIKAKNIKVAKVSESELKFLIQRAERIRYIVSITKNNHEEFYPGSFKYEIGKKWVISGGFKNIESNSLYERLMVSGVNNTLVISEGKYGKEGICQFIGHGAGANPTTAAMMKDFEDFKDFLRAKIAETEQ